ncbi:MAG: IS1595 family transposase [bacterium]|nr:IS1595 family transposase [bacterium]
MNIVKIYELFPTEDDCLSHLESVRWNGKPTCPYCKSDKVTPAPKEKRHHCNNCNTSFSVTVGTIFHHTHLPLQKWLLALCLILNAKKGISSRQLSRDLRVHKDTAWRISMKIREAMREPEQRRLLTGVVEVDETYVGGKPRKGGGKNHKTGDHSKAGRGTKKVPVIGLIEREGMVKTKVLKEKCLTKKKLSTLVRRTVNTKETILVTDQWPGYAGIKQFMAHETINHSECYCIGDIHTNNIESFWAILKRGIVGQFHKVSVHYLHKYLDEFSYRFNNRKNPFLFEYTIAKALGVNP